MTTNVGEAVSRLRNGGLVALPTETVYGLGADAGNPHAVLRVFAAKRRPADHPLIVHLATSTNLAEWAADVPDGALALADAFWPGPLTILLKKRPDVDPLVTGGRATIGLRVPSHPLAQELLRAFGSGVCAPSANRFGRVSPTTAAHVLADLGEVLDPFTDLILDGGPCEIGLESTIIDLSSDSPLLLLHGAIPSEALSAVLGVDVEVDRGPARAPGMLAAHYAPSAAVIPVEALDVVARCAELARLPNTTVALLAQTDDSLRNGEPASTDLLGEVVRLRSPFPYTGAAIASVLYARFREADALGATHLVVELPSPAGLGRAVIDRVLRAAASSHVRQPPGSSR